MPLQRWQITLAELLEEGVADPLEVDVIDELFFTGAGGVYTLENLLTSVGHEGVGGVVERIGCRPCTSLSAFRAR
jgi:3'-phosphoadenosine 5'-phosphosulfate sulfotransferase (PAPS reductase)/FAD synthetase